jgi:ABC-type glucose/galactose transport system permease subunit
LKGDPGLTGPAGKDGLPGKDGATIRSGAGNPEAAKVSGVNVAVNLVVIYALAGVFYAFGGMLEAGRIGSATNNLGFMYELDAIAACVVEGVFSQPRMRCAGGR